MVALLREFCLEPDTNKRLEMMKEYNRLFTENIYSVGVVIGRYGLALAKRFKNVPVGTPTFLYQWTWANVRPEQVWIAPEDQLPQLRPNTIPIYGE